MERFRESARGRSASAGKQVAFPISDSGRRIAGQDRRVSWSQPNVTRTSPETASGRRQSRIERAHAGPTACPDALTGHAGWFGRDGFLPGDPGRQARAARGRCWRGADAESAF
jgi:hypothetical protein